MPLFLRCRWVVVNLVDKSMSYFGENPQRTMYLYGVQERPKGTLDIAKAVATAATPQECARAPTPHCIVLKTPARDMLLCAR